MWIRCAEVNRGEMFLGRSKDSIVDLLTNDRVFFVFVFFYKIYVKQSLVVAKVTQFEC